MEKDLDKLSQKAASGTAWRLAEEALIKIVDSIVTIVLARLINVEAYATLAITTSFIAITNVILKSGLKSSLIQNKDVDDYDYSTIFIFDICFAIVLYLILFFLAPYIATYFDDVNLKNILRVASISILISSTKFVVEAYMHKNLLFKSFFWSSFVGTLVSAIVGIVLAYSGFGIWALVAQNLSDLFIDSIIMLIVSIKKYNLHIKLFFSFKRLKKFFHFGWKLLAINILDIVSTHLRSFVIGKKYTSKDLAFYDKGNTIPSKITSSINATVNDVIFPVLSKLQDDYSVVKTSCKTILKVMAFFIIPAMFGMAFVSDSLVEVLLTKKWLFCVPYMKIACLSGLLMPMQIINNSITKSLGKGKSLLIVDVLRKIIGLALIIVSMRISVYAIALSLLLENIVSTIIGNIPVWKTIKYSLFEQILDIAESLIPSILMSIVVHFVGTIPLIKVLVLFVQIVSGFIIYLFYMTVTKNKTFKYITNLIIKNLIK